MTAPKALPYGEHIYHVYLVQVEDLKMHFPIRRGLFKNPPRSLRTEIVRYLREREADADWFDGTVMTARKATKRNGVTEASRSTKRRVYSNGSLPPVSEVPVELSFERLMINEAEFSFIGELAPLLRLPRSASVRAAGDAVVTGYTLRRFRKNHPSHWLAKA